MQILKVCDRVTSLATGNHGTIQRFTDAGEACVLFDGGDAAVIIGNDLLVLAHHKVSYVGAPAIFALDLACMQINDAFGDFGCYLVGSALDRPNWRDVDVRFIMRDEEFAALFPDATVFEDGGGCWEQNSRWLLLTVSISGWLSGVTGLKVDFQIQPQKHANARHPGKRHSLGLRIGKRKA